VSPKVEENASASQDIPVSPLFGATCCRHHSVKSLDGSPSDDADDGAAGGLVADRSAIDLAGGDEAVRDALAALASLGATPLEVPRMLRDFPSGLTLAAVTGTLYALKMYLALLHWNFGDDACDLLVLVGIMLSATGFFGEFVAAARLNRRLREASAEIDQRKRRFNESARARALRLNAYALASLDGTTATHSAMVAPEMAKVTPAFGFGFRLKVVRRILAVAERPNLRGRADH
jgi:hypothetical protein